MKLKAILTLLFLTLSFHGFAAVDELAKIEEIGFKTHTENHGTMTIQYNGRLRGNPELTVKDRMVQIEVPNSYVWPKIEKKATINGQFDTTLMAYQFNDGLVRIRAMLPFSLKGKENLVNVVLRDGNIELNIPTVETKTVSAPVQAKKNVPTPKTAPRVEPQIEAQAAKREAAQYDESYLTQLLNEKPAQADLAGDFEEASDKVSVAQSGQEKIVGAKENNFSITGYIGKFVAFLGLVLLLFYGIVSLMKKGVFKKSSLGFLNSTKMIEVLNTTYVGPKKSLMMVKAHNQIFLVSSTDAGMTLISEIKDVSGLLKEGEKQIAGSNFDSSLGEAEEKSPQFKLKAVAQGSALSLDQLLDEKPVKDTVKLSDQIKTKVKSLKSLQ